MSKVAATGRDHTEASVSLRLKSFRKSTAESALHHRPGLALQLR